MANRFTVIDVPQRSAEWFAARCGRLCGSVACDIMSRVKVGEAAARRDLRLRLVCEKLTGISAESDYENADMRRGRELENDARAAYEVATGNLVQQVGFLAHNELAIGCSPDGVIGDWEGLAEFKVPRSATHLRYLRTKGLPPEHAIQVTHSLLVSGVEWVDFASYDPRFPPDLQLFIVRVKRTDVDLAAYELCVRAFLSEVEKELAEVEQLRMVAA